MARHKKMYKDSPKLERNEETGNMGITRGAKDLAETNAGTDGIAEHDSKDEGIPTHVRHAIERRDLNGRQENEHMVHDHSGVDKAEMHKRHQEEIKSMHKRHEKEHGKTGADEVKKVEETKKGKE